MRILMLLVLPALLASCSTLWPEEEDLGCTSDPGAVCIEITKGSEQLQAELEALIIRQEGYRRHPYPDTNGTQAIGFARNLTTNGISKEEARYLLRNDVSRIKDQLEKRFPITADLDRTRYNVLVIMAYVVGVDGLADFDLMWEKIRQRDYSAAAIEIVMSDMCTQIKPKRCTELAEMMHTGV